MDLREEAFYGDKVPIGWSKTRRILYFGLSENI